MKFAIITHVPHIKYDDYFFGYAPYIREMNIWLKFADEVLLVAPLVHKELNPIFEKYTHSTISFTQVGEFNITSFSNFFKTILQLPTIIKQVFQAMHKADHIHLRCPGNMGLIGAVVQIFFPNKPKTAKYAGNWDPNAKQPFTYKLQRWILSNTFLTRNMQVLVYGEWSNQTKNIKPFFTATYSATEIQDSAFSIQHKPDLQPIIFLFVGTLSRGKRPLYVIQLVEELHKRGEKVILELYGEGVLGDDLASYIVQHQLDDFVFLKGNQSKETILSAYQNSHFLLLPSQSEGWPKVVAEAMFWGCIPIASPVSCVSYMIGNGSRGILLQEQLEQDIDQILVVIHNKLLFQQMALAGQDWSRQFTTDQFEIAIQQLLVK